MRISDWSSDVCSSDLQAANLRRAGPRRKGRIDAVDVEGNVSRSVTHHRERLLDHLGDAEGRHLLSVDHRHAAVEGELPEVLRRAANADLDRAGGIEHAVRSEEHTSELQSLMRISYAVFC